MGDYGIKGSRPGYNIQDLQDYLQIFNSSFPHLKLEEYDDFTGTVTHDLGYPPFHFIAKSDGRVDQNAGLVTDNYGVSSTVLAKAFGSNKRYFLFRQDIETDFDADSFSGGTTSTTGDDNFGFKLTKDGEDISSTDLRDFSLHSNTATPLLHKISEGAMSNTGGGLGFERTVAHGLGYTPIAFAYIKPGTNSLGLNSSRWCIVPGSTGAAGAYYTVDATNVYVTADNSLFTGSPRASVVVLKDPFDKEEININFP